MRNAHCGIGVNGVISQFGRSLQISPAVLELLFAEQKMRDVNSAFRISPYPPTTSIRGHKESDTNFGRAEESSNGNPRRLCQNTGIPTLVAPGKIRR
jgi:hypothetical protein